MRLTLFAPGLLLFLAGALRAEIRSSADYGIVTDVTDSAGGRSSSALYTNDGSVGGILGTATAPASELTDTGGYIAQLGGPGFVVTTLTDSGPGSLRQVIADAPANATVTFDRTLSGQTITLAGSELLLAKDVILDASALPGGITVSGDVTGNGPTGDDSRIFEIAAGRVVEMSGLAIAGGNSVGDGGGVYNAGGRLTLRDCRIQNNRAASHGGGIANAGGGEIHLHRVTVSGNAATTGGGGGIFDQFSVNGVTIDNSTLSGNSAVFGAGVYSQDSFLEITGSTVSDNATNSSAGGGVYLQNTSAILTHTTIAGNTAVGSGGGGMVVANFSGGIELTLDNALIAGNSGSPGPDIWYFSGILNATGVNLIGNNATVATAFPNGSPNANGDLVGVPALLAPLGDYGGPTRTRALLPGSPAREATVGSTSVADQRGFPLVGIADIGAYEAGNFTGYNAWIWESLPGGATAAQHEAGTDFDGDEATNNEEWFALTDPASGSSFFAPESFRSGANLVITFPTGVGRLYRLQQSGDLAPGSWIAAPGQPLVNGNGSILGFTVPRTGVSRRFYRIGITGP